nr:MAG TPA: nuclease [Caudoviricetes sp.]
MLVCCRGGAIRVVWSPSSNLGLSENKNTHLLTQIALTYFVRAILLSERIEIEKMDVLQETIAVYERLRKKRYRIIVETGEDFTFVFQPANYHHLAGFQHLTDFQNISSPKSKDQFYGLVKRQHLQEEYVQESSHYNEISERLNTFSYLEDILAEGDGKIIVEYDRSKLSSEIEAKYYLYKRVGRAFDGEVTYHILFIGSMNERFFPATYIVEHSNIYIREQELRTCQIIHQEK